MVVNGLEVAPMVGNFPLGGVEPADSILGKGCMEDAGVAKGGEGLGVGACSKCLEETGSDGWCSVSVSHPGVKTL